MIIFLLIWRYSKIEPQLFKENKGQNGVGSESDEGWNEAFEKGLWTLSRSESDQTHGSFELTRLSIHGTSF